MPREVTFAPTTVVQAGGWAAVNAATIIDALSASVPQRTGRHHLGTAPHVTGQDATANLRLAWAPVDVPAGEWVESMVVRLVWTPLGSAEESRITLFVFTEGPGGALSAIGPRQVNLAHSWLFDQPVVGGLAYVTRARVGFYALGTDGGVFALGGARFHGNPISSIAGDATTAVALGVHPNGLGYWVLAANGAVFTFSVSGSVKFWGRSSGVGSPAVAILPTASGAGYWILHQNGVIVECGDAAVYTDITVGALTVRDAAVRPQGDGFVAALSDGTVAVRGAMVDDGNAVGQLGAHNVVGVAVHPSGRGYYIALTSGKVIAVGAPARGDLAGVAIVPVVTGIAAAGEALILSLNAGKVAIVDPYGSSLALAMSVGRRKASFHRAIAADREDFDVPIEATIGATAVPTWGGASVALLGADLAVRFDRRPVAGIDPISDTGTITETSAPILVPTYSDADGDPIGRSRVVHTLTSSLATAAAAAGVALVDYVAGLEPPVGPPIAAGTLDTLLGEVVDDSGDVAGAPAPIEPRTPMPNGQSVDRLLWVASERRYPDGTPVWSNPARDTIILDLELPRAAPGVLTVLAAESAFDLVVVGGDNVADVVTAHPDGAVSSSRYVADENASAPADTATPVPAVRFGALGDGRARMRTSMEFDWPEGAPASVVATVAAGAVDVADLGTARVGFYMKDQDGVVIDRVLGDPVVLRRRLSGDPTPTPGATYRIDYSPTSSPTAVVGPLAGTIVDPPTIYPWLTTVDLGAVDIDLIERWLDDVDLGIDEAAPLGVAEGITPANGAHTLIFVVHHTDGTTTTVTATWTMAVPDPEAPPDPTVLGFPTRDTTGHRVRRHVLTPVGGNLDLAGGVVRRDLQIAGQVTMRASRAELHDSWIQGGRIGHALGRSTIPKPWPLCRYVTISPERNTPDTFPRIDRNADFGAARHERCLLGGHIDGYFSTAGSGPWDIYESYIYAPRKLLRDFDNQQGRPSHCDGWQTMGGMAGSKFERVHWSLFSWGTIDGTGWNANGHEGRAGGANYGCSQVTAAIAHHQGTNTVTDGLWILQNIFDGKVNAYFFTHPNDSGWKCEFTIFVVRANEANLVQKRVISGPTSPFATGGGYWRNNYTAPDRATALAAIEHVKEPGFAPAAYGLQSLSLAQANTF